MNTEKRLVWLVLGILVGLGVAYFWPHEPVSAAVADRTDKFMMITSPVGYAAGTEAVWVLDFLTGRLQGAVIDDKTGKFMQFYVRNDLAKDFGLPPGATPQYAMVTTATVFTSRPGGQLGAAAIHIGELVSGKVNAYGFQFRETTQRAPVQPLVPLDSFPFRQSLGQ